jgi:hypothetical protein
MERCGFEGERVKENTVQSLLHVLFIIFFVLSSAIPDFSIVKFEHIILFSPSVLKDSFYFVAVHILLQYKFFAVHICCST